MRWTWTTIPTRPHSLHFALAEPLARHRLSTLRFQTKHRCSSKLDGCAGAPMDYELQATTAKWFPNFRAALECQYVSSWFQNQINTVPTRVHLQLGLGYRYKQVEFLISWTTDKLYATNVSRGNATWWSGYIILRTSNFHDGIASTTSLKKNNYYSLSGYPLYLLRPKGLKEYHSYPAKNTQNEKENQRHLNEKIPNG
jgi:hypothetical protein